MILAFSENSHFCCKVLIIHRGIMLFFTMILEYDQVLAHSVTLDARVARLVRTTSELLAWHHYVHGQLPPLVGTD